MGGNLPKYCRCSWDKIDEIDVGENQYTAIYNIITNNSMEPRDDITLDASVDFSAVP